MKKKVLLLMTSLYSIHEIIVLNLEKMGYEVTYRDVKLFKYKGIGERLYNFFRKTILKDKDYKDYLKKKVVDDDIRKVFQDSQFDYALVIRPDAYSPETIHFLKKIAKMVIGYQWDGFSRFKIPPELIDAFDTFGVFDRKDFDKYSNIHPNIKLTQNFFFDVLPTPPQKEIDLLYIGANLEDRFEKLKHIVDISKDKNTYFRLFSHEKLPLKSGIICDSKLLDYKETLENSSKAKCLIDMKLAVHNGLSLRFFEALYFNQKIITDNPTVREKDFYNSNNILIVEDFKKLTKEELEEFLMKEYIEISKEIKRKYSFENWFNTMIS